jgi:hypothetical protein
MDPQRLFFVAAAVAQFALWLVFAGRYKPPAPTAGSTVLRYGGALRLFSLAFAFAVPVGTVVIFAVVRGNDASPIPLGITLLVCGFVVGILMMETQGVFMIVADDKIISLSPWRRRREWRWHEIEQVTFSRLHWSLELHGPRQETIRASLFLVGIGDLARAILRRVSGIKCAPARKRLDRLAK